MCYNMDKYQFFKNQLFTALMRNDIPYMCVQGEYDRFGDEASYGIIYDTSIMIQVYGNSLGHSDVFIYLNKEKLEAVIVNDASEQFLWITGILKQLYGVEFRERKKISQNKTLFSF